MVKIAVAGGSGQVSKEIIDVLLESKRHQIIILSRKEAPTGIPDAPKLKWQVVDYNDKKGLVEVLRGTHTLLSFVQTLSDPDQKSQKNLIDAAIEAGVKRFAPSEYGSNDTVDMAWLRVKQNIREYLEDVNQKGQVLEYTLFQQGIFLDYLAYPYKTSKHVDPLQSVFDFENRRAIVVDGHEDAIMTLTTVADLARVVARAVDYEGTWPKVSGIRGNRVTFSQIVEIGERIRGRPFIVDKVKVEDLENGELKTNWNIKAIHKMVSEDQALAFLKAVSIGILLSSSKGAWDISDELNQLFPDFEFTQIEDFLTKVWEGKK
ncbi:NAD(P)-binding protein [Annulohypoxylon maeteangense]|uniref:NAD(P)-binding protein n=1 Tax=Annulohypoxylon maeteangense TaxID=1927788 RepID=UPI0020083BBA|nr:NAD(P)-binding protein [Annulohypoxylon maeteangense]KAI0886562.1 NAD(P)-binding protein [Annulohypoxylon maeteangense]